MKEALFAGCLAFAIALVIGRPIVRLLRSRNVGKSISDYMPESHSVKAGTPTFGGFIIWVPTFIVTAVMVDWWEHQSILLPLGMIGLTGAAGFVDDLGSLQNRSIGGLSWRVKIGLTTVLACGAAYALYEYLEVESLNVPWAGQYELGILYLPIAAATIVATTAAVAVSDGLDALAGGTTLIAFIAYAAIAFIQGQEYVASFALIIAGANLGFLWYNAHPAQIIMGDTGALALGSSLAVVALMTGHWLLLPVIGIIFVGEALSDILQIASFKLTGGKRRLFKQAPYHQHLERIGWPETKIVSRFWVIGMVAAMLGIALALAVPE
ncbi:MAG: phospho-N-acetylmuramoyl-pentapeptide-transferase [Dehalococcoidia bacterium]